MKFKTLAAVLVLSWVPFFLRAENPQAVRIVADDRSLTLDNGIITAQIAKVSGSLISLRYQHLEMLDVRDHESAYWSHQPPQFHQEVQITIDPQANGGERGEVSIKGISRGAGTMNTDVEIRYALGRGDTGLYTYSIFSHPTNYPGTSIGEARFCLKLNDAIFDWMTVDAERNMKMITAYDWNHGTQMNFKEGRRMNTGLYPGVVEHKYDYAANQFDVRTWGWSSSDRHVGIWLVNPSAEYLSGGPTKFELSAHRDATFRTNAFNAPAPPALLNYWRSSHYGGSLCNIAATDAWSKVIGPFLIYCNTGNNHDALWQDALAREQTETKAWPYDWVEGVDYPHKNQRAMVSGQIELNDPQAPGQTLKHLLVGLTAPDYAPAVILHTNRNGGHGGYGLAGGGDDEAGMTNSPATDTNNLTRSQINAQDHHPRGQGHGLRRAGGNRPESSPRVVDWQIDAKNYQFWAKGDDDGHFVIPKVRPGTYTLHAIADGVLGELVVSNVMVTAPRDLALGRLEWRPVRYGRQLWDIGIPNRSGAEFFKGDDYFHWGWYLQYPKLFPNDVNYVIGQSDFHKDWFFEQVPYNENTNNTTGGGRGGATTWTVTFNLPKAPAGKATLRLAICGTGARNLMVDLNDQPIGNLTNLIYDATINRDGISGRWREHDVVFDAGLMKRGKTCWDLPCRKAV